MQVALATLAAVGAGMVNSLAGGGTLLTFPSLLAIGVPALSANVTNTIALLPGYMGGIIAQRRELSGQHRRLSAFLPAGLLGGITGGVLLLATGERLFRALVPFLILLATALLALQEPVRRWLLRHIAGPVSRGGAGSPRSESDPASRGGTARYPAGLEGLAVPMVALAAVYGGYFGAGVGVILMAVLGLLVHDSLGRLNALKQTISLAANCAAAIYFCFSGKVVWPVVAPMAAGALAGGWIGGRLAGRLSPSLLRWSIVAIGFTVGIASFRR